MQSVHAEPLEGTKLDAMHHAAGLKELVSLNSLKTALREGRLSSFYILAKGGLEKIL